MPRADEYTGQLSNPVKKYLTWDSDNKCFKHYNKEIKQNISVKLPLSFIVLKQMTTIKGFSEKDGCGIYANELPLNQLKTKEFNVKTLKGRSLVSGTYEKIKADLAVLGGKFANNIYAYLDGEIVCITLVGSSFSAWYDFTAKESSAVKNNFVSITSAEDKKKGKTVYTQPIFTVGAEIDEKVGADADKAYDDIVAYIKGRENSSTEEPIEEAPALPRLQEEPVAMPAETDDVLPF